MTVHEVVGNASCKFLLFFFNFLNFPGEAIHKRRLTHFEVPSLQADFPKRVSFDLRKDIRPQF